jgi:hypothetical protein
MMGPRGSDSAPRARSWVPRAKARQGQLLDPYNLGVSRGRLSSQDKSQLLFAAPNRRRTSGGFVTRPLRSGGTPCPPRPWVMTTAAGRLFQARGPSAFGGRPLSRRVPGPKRSRRSDPSRSHRPSDRRGSAGMIGASSIKSRPGRGLLRSRLRVDEVGEIFADLYPAPFPDAIHDLEDVMHAPARREPVRPQA